MTIANLAMEMGVKCVFTPIDEKTEAYLSTRLKKPHEPVRADTDVIYAKTVGVDASSLVPTVSCPSEVDNTDPINPNRK